MRCSLDISFEEFNLRIVQHMLLLRFDINQSFRVYWVVQSFPRNNTHPRLYGASTCPLSAALRNHKILRFNTISSHDSKHRWYYVSACPDSAAILNQDTAFCSSLRHLCHSHSKSQAWIDHPHVHLQLPPATRRPLSACPSQHQDIFRIRMSISCEKSML